MSDDVTAAIESSIAGLDDGGAAEPAAPAAPSSVAPAAPAASAPPATPPAVPATPPADPAAPPADPAQPGGKKKTGAFVPLDRHESTITNIRDEGTRAVAAVRAEYEGQITELRNEVTTRSEALTVMETDPERFLSALAQADPRYASLVRLPGNGAAPAAAAPAHAAPAAPSVDEPMPEPDSPDGYTPAGLRKLLEWNSRVTEARVAERYAPIETAHRSHAAVSQAAANVRAKVEGMLSRPGFAESQPQIAAAMRANPRLTLEGAYIDVVLSRLQPSRDTMRAELLAELHGKPKSVSITAPTASPVAAAASDDLISVINASIAGLE